MEQQLVRFDISALLEQNRQIQILVDKLKNENKKLKNNLEYERELRFNAEKELKELKSNGVKKRKTAEERYKERKEKANRLKRGTTKTGKTLSTPSDSINSYDDFKAIQQGLLVAYPRKGIQYKTIWSLGCAIGVRVSDVLDLQWNDFYDNDWNFREYACCYEIKTGKQNNFLITEAVKQYLSEFLLVQKTNPNLEDKIFQSQKKIDKSLPFEVRIKKEKDYRSSVSAEIKAVAERILNQHITSHGMRKSFAKIVGCCYDCNMDEKTIGILQALLNHSDARITARYNGEAKRQLNNARVAVSDFLLGKSINKLEKPRQVTNNELMAVLQEIKQNQILKSEEIANETL